jgi:antitoxin (DNA-binding transcriptional repressor) of toxin-antitoxin stability system
MGEPATPIRRRIELTVAEARLRFQQLVRVTGLTGQITVVVDGGRPVAAIVPVSDVLGAGPAPPGVAPPAESVAPASSAPASSAPASSAPASSAPVAVNAAGWMRRIEKVREDVRRQHAQRIGDLSQALDEAWRLLDDLRPAGTDRSVDTLRAAHTDLRKAS